jgi:hypothetical protein
MRKWKILHSVGTRPCSLSKPNDHYIAARSQEDRMTLNLPRAERTIHTSLTELMQKVNPIEIRLNMGSYEFYLPFTILRS